MQCSKGNKLLFAIHVVDIDYIVLVMHKSFTDRCVVCLAEAQHPFELAHIAEALIYGRQY